MCVFKPLRSKWPLQVEEILFSHEKISLQKNWYKLKSEQKKRTSNLLLLVFIYNLNWLWWCLVNVHILHYITYQRLQHYKWGPNYLVSYFALHSYMSYMSYMSRGNNNSMIVFWFYICQNKDHQDLWYLRWTHKRLIF